MSTKEELEDIITGLHKAVANEHNLYVTANNALQPYVKSTTEMTAAAIEWEMKAKMYRAAFIVIVSAIVVTMFVIIGLAVYFK